MKKLAPLAIAFLIMFAVFLAVGEAATIQVDCSSASLQAAVEKAKPGDTLLVSGTCKENLVIYEEVVRITLDGQRKATINGPDASKPTIEVRGRGITIRGFTVTGGLNGIRLDGAHGIIDGNTVQGAAGHGVFLGQASFAIIVNNTIQNNPSNGINVGGNSRAYIGVFGGTAKTASPNITQNNGENGIAIISSSSAFIVGNTIRNNKLNGVIVNGVSQARVSSNTIDGNGRVGLVVRQNSAVSLGRGTGTGILDLPNSSGSNNGGVGISCASNCSVDGRLGSLNGNKGAKDFDPSCVDTLKP